MDTLPPRAPTDMDAVSATAPAPDAGTPPCPTTEVVTVWPAATATLSTSPPSSGLNPPPADPNGTESSDVPCDVAVLAGTDGPGSAEPVDPDLQPVSVPTTISAVTAVVSAVRNLISTPLLVTP
jgi:hypothetical protein